jgi:hypothetical protein
MEIRDLRNISHTACMNLVPWSKNMTHNIAEPPWRHKFSYIPQVIKCTSTKRQWLILSGAKSRSACPEIHRLLYSRAQNSPLLKNHYEPQVQITTLRPTYLTWAFILSFPLRLGLLCGPVPSRLPTKSLYAFSISSRVVHASPVSLSLMKNKDYEISYYVTLSSNMFI